MSTLVTSPPKPTNLVKPRPGREWGTAVRGRLLTWFAYSIFLFLYLPILILVIYSFNANKVVGVWTGFTADWYRVLFNNQAMISAFKVSMWVATWSTLISTILGTLAALSLERYRYRGKLPFDAVMYLPIIIPDIVMALSALLFFVIVAIPLSRYTILIAHVAFNISFVAVIVRSRLADMDHNLEEAAADLGANEWTAFRRITLPLLMPAIVSGALLAFTLSLDDFVITFFVSGPGSTTLPVRVYSMIKFGVTPEVNAISTLMLLGSTFLVVLSLVLQRRS
ncbi:MAG: ABC transporter permease [Chloroflexi bacterium]|nr:ABC transporter permease [Ardenticatenaceae bacterium]MBL1128345.1 ABC transporter permease [Chloroflexota bacterium]NOG34420.1 ABC transporter permease [Chloroflexota bacterium]GIK57691.1 MAG: ornithine carbamoyltransferase [Chloroflexota bacterium]